MLVCDECGGTNIHVLAWVDANTNEYISDGCNDRDDKWCENCQEHVDFKDKPKHRKNGKDITKS